MDMTNIMYELVNTKTSLTIADRTIETLQKQNRRLNRRCLRQSLMIAGLTWLTVTACRMLRKTPGSSTRNLLIHSRCWTM